jgi:UDPglucose 6-dehydrogenase
MKIAITGTGYVDLSSAMLLAQHNEVVALDIISEKIDQLNRKESPIADAGMIRDFSDKIVSRDLFGRDSYKKILVTSAAGFIGSSFSIRMLERRV